MQAACFQASRATPPTIYHGVVHLFRVEIPPPRDLFELDDLLGWKPWLKGQVHTEIIPGRHGVHLLEPHVATLAKKLRAAIEANSTCRTR